MTFLRNTLKSCIFDWTCWLISFYDMNNDDTPDKSWNVSWYLLMISSFVILGICDSAYDIVGWYFFYISTLFNKQLKFFSIPEISSGCNFSGEFIKVFHSVINELLVHIALYSEYWIQWLSWEAMVGYSNLAISKLGLIWQFRNPYISY